MSIQEAQWAYLLDVEDVAIVVLDYNMSAMPEKGVDVKVTPFSGPKGEQQDEENTESEEDVSERVETRRDWMISTPSEAGRHTGMQVA